MSKKKSEEEELQDPKEMLRNFVIESKVDAFMNTYLPCESEEDADDVFDDKKLRKYFSAWQRSQGDPLSIYLDEYLIPNGFKMVSSDLTGDPEPILLVKFR